MIHELKTIPPYFKDVQLGDKTFEVRKNDRDFKVGDALLLQEFLPNTNEYTGQRITLDVSYVLTGEEWGIKEGYCVLGFVKLN